MASVAICPHCYLQLIVPDGVEPEEQVKCPTCAKEFGLDQAVLRAIPEVVRRSTAVASLAESSLTETVEIEEIVAEVSDESADDIIEQIKARVEEELSANGLLTDIDADIEDATPIDQLDEATALSQFADNIASDTNEDIAEPRLDLVSRPDDDLAAWFRNGQAMPDVSSVDEAAISEDEDAISPTAAEGADAPAAELEIEAIIDRIDEIREPADFVPEPLESRLARPAAITLADLLPPREELKADEVVDEVTGPLFDLPNVQLTPNNGATIEIDPNMSFGPAAETEFELDDVDFAAPPTDDLPADESYELEPVLSDDERPAVVGFEPAPEFTSHDEQPVMTAVPFVVPAVPRTKKKRSVVRTLAGSLLGGVVGLSLGYFVLLYLLGPEGDLLHVAEYLPNAVLPASLKSEQTNIAQTTGSPATTAIEESANVPAGYVEDVKPTDDVIENDESAADDRYGTEPSLLDEPAAAPIEDASPGPKSLLVDSPTYTVEQLATAFEAGKEAQAGLTTGDLSDAAVRRTKGMSYAKLCDLANALVFVDRSSLSVESEEAIDATNRLFRETLADEHTRNEVARIAAIWIDSPHRSHGGIFAAGTISGGQIVGDVYEYELTTDVGNKLTLLMQEPLDPLVESSGQPVGIVGSIVDRPAENVAGYNGTAERAIWVGRAISLE